MTKSELIEAVSSRKPELSKKDVETVVNTVFDTMVSAMVQDFRIEIRGFGSFVVKRRGARDGRNPKTGEKVFVPTKRIPFFTVGKELRERVDGQEAASSTNGAAAGSEAVRDGAVRDGAATRDGVPTRDGAAGNGVSGTGGVRDGGGAQGAGAGDGASAAASAPGSFRASGDGGDGV